MAAGVIAVDGTTVRGAKDVAGNLVHLLSGVCQRADTVLGQITVGATTTEIPILSKLLDLMDIVGAVITADAMQCQRESAEYTAKTPDKPSLEADPHPQHCRRRGENTQHFSTFHGVSPTAEELNNLIVVTLVG